MVIKRNHPDAWEGVFEIVRLIPLGRVSTYGAIADYLQLASPRMVGWALMYCDQSAVFVPAHRVVNAKGELSGRHRFGSPTMMQELLEAEGVIIENEKVKRFKDLLWLPLVELI